MHDRCALYLWTWYRDASDDDFVEVEPVKAVRGRGRPRGSGRGRGKGRGGGQSKSSRKVKRYVLGPFLNTFSSTDDFCSKATVSSDDEAEEGEEEEQATGDENEEGDGESLGGDEEDKRDEALDFME